MKVRVRQQGSDFYSEYFNDNLRVPRWESTYRNANCVVQNRFGSLEEAIAECKRFSENYEMEYGKIVWEVEWK